MELERDEEKENMIKHMIRDGDDNVTSLFSKNYGEGDDQNRRDGSNEGDEQDRRDGSGEGESDDTDEGEADSWWNLKYYKCSNGVGKEKKIHAKSGTKRSLFRLRLRLLHAVLDVIFIVCLVIFAVA
jgi:hypothetical protein